jgi:uncharacterized protein (TIGR02246 family)
MLCSGSPLARSATLVLLVMGMGAACAKSENRAGDEAAIRALDADWVKAAAAKNAEQFASFYADDGTLMAPGAPMTTGRVAVQKAVAGLMALPGFALTFAPTTVDVGGDGAYEIGDYSLTTNDAKGTPQTAKGKYVVLWRRQADGKWRVRLDAPTTTQ